MPQTSTRRPADSRLALLLVVALACSTVTMLAQLAFVDDAQRTVAVPAAVSRVFAAGAPAEVLLYTLAPEQLVGRNRVPEGEALEFFPPAFRAPVFIRQLPEVDNPAADAELVALKPHLYVDYGTVQADYVESVAAVQKRTGVAGVILSGELSRIPAVYRRLGPAMGVTAKANRLGEEAERLLTTYRGALAGARVRVYLACSSDGFQPCLADQSAGEQLAWLGGVNVAGTRESAPRRPLTVDEIKALSPQVIIVNGPPGSAARLRANPVWQSVEAVSAGRVHEWPSLPYSWGPRPPSVNRLPGLAWLARVASGRPFDDAFNVEIRAFYREFYHLVLTDAQLRRLLQS